MRDLVRVVFGLWTGVGIRQDLGRDRVKGMNIWSRN